MNQIIQRIDKKSQTAEHVEFKVGYTISVGFEIIEGQNKRIQNFDGIVIEISGRGINKRVRLRKISSNCAVEKTFLYHSPIVKNIKVLKKGRVRRAKIFYLRDRVGKQALRVKSVF